MMDAGSGVFCVEEAPVEPVSYSRTIWFGNERIRIGLRKDVAPSLLLNLLIDVAADRIESGNTFMPPAVGRTNSCTAPLTSVASTLFIPSVNGPCSPQQWGEDLYRDVQNHLSQSISFGLSLQLALFDSLSTHRYEGAGCRGGLAFEGDENKDTSSLLNMPIEAVGEIPFEKDRLRQIRKLLAGAGDHFLVFQRQGGEYLCRGYCSKDVSAQFEWRVRFTDVLDWEFYHYEYPLFRFLRNDPKIIQDPIAAVLKDLKGEFGPHYDWVAARPLLESGVAQQHGTALIFMDFQDRHISTWMDRLYQHKRMIRLNSCEDERTAVQYLSGMDGAILIDVHTMKVQYFTAIMDGRVFVDGDLSRGARHNSIRTFIADLVRTSPRHSSKLAAVIFSEDGGTVTICGKQFLPPAREKFSAN